MTGLTLTPWARRRLMFAHMYEDFRVEEAALEGRQRILAIASAGDTALVLARGGASVTAIDINPAQIAFLERRLSSVDSLGGGDAGRVDRIMGAGRTILRVAGWRQDRLERFCQMDDPDQQVAEWRRLTAGLPGRTLRVLLAPAALRVAYRPDFARWADELGRQLPDRIEQRLARHPNRDSPWVRLLFLGTPLGVPGAASSSARLATVVGDVATYLEHVEPGRYDGFALSNVLDGAPPAYRSRLLAAVRHSGPPDAPVVLRTLGAPPTAGAAMAAAADRALIWGGITVTEAGALR